jgi:curved DNA-binding protein CbpA
MEEAYSVLGLEHGATAVQINKAHHQMMKKFHPDHGGSEYLASKINQARDVLLAGV